LEYAIRDQRDFDTFHYYPTEHGRGVGRVAD
jgi:hypothetical protein